MNILTDITELWDCLKRIEEKVDKLLNQKPIEPPVQDKTIIFKDWEKTCEAGGVIELKDGYTYLVPNYRTCNLSKDLTITCNGKATIIFGKDYYNQWLEDTEQRFIFSLGQWNNKISIQNVDLFTGKPIEQVQPFFRTLFWNNTKPNQTGTIELINCNTNLEYGLLYSGSQDQYLTCKAINVNFEGVMFQELKCPNGGGLFSYQRNCELIQIDPVTNFEANLIFLKDEVISDVSFYSIENEFNGSGNSANIIYVDGMTFYLPKGLPQDKYKHHIRPIPQAGEYYNLYPILEDAGHYTDAQFMSNEVNLQVGDILEYNGEEYTIIKTDRLIGNYFPQTKYSMYYQLDRKIKTTGQIKVRVLKSNSEKLLDGKGRKGYMIFKYNKDFTTELNKETDLNFILASNPFGVLSYNHKEITVDWENVVHNGFYRQSASNVGQSNGYRLVNCTGFKDEFNPPVNIQIN